jgi:predicted ATPase/transcriptional regulator with XRE-family HTH domain
MPGAAQSEPGGSRRTRQSHAVSGAPTGGQLLRQYRVVVGLTQEQLAERSGYSADYISKLERDQRQPPIVAIDRLIAVLGLGAAEKRALLAALARHDRRVGLPGISTASAEPESASATMLPASMSSFVGRDQEVSAVAAILLRKDVRLLTLTGPGGIGKTRLAMRVAEVMGKTFADGVHFISLASVADPRQVASAVASAFGLEEVAGVSRTFAIVTRLGDRNVLLILDNFEHVLAAAELVASLMRQCAGLRVLVTSRAALQLSGEHRFEVPPLPTPGADQLNELEHVAGQAAVRLFVERAQAVQPSFELDPASAPAVGEICRSLDGLPLAIELAAARVRVFPPRALLQRLTPRLKLLSGGAVDAPPRHRTLQATIDWSFDLLSPTEQILLARLSVFAGGCTFESVEHVCNPDENLDILQDLTALIDKSLVHDDGLSQPQTQPRFSLLETIREYAATRLEDLDERKLIRDQHAEYVLWLCRQLEPLLIGPRQFDALSQVDAELDNVRVALGWRLEQGRAEDALELAESLSRYWIVRGRCTEARRWLEAGWAHAAQLPPDRRAKVLLALGGVALEEGQLEGATRALEEALEEFRTLQDEPGIGQVLNRLGVIAWRQGAYERAISFDEAALRIAISAQDPRERADALVNLGIIATHRGDFNLARERLTEAVQLTRGVGDQHAVLHALVNLGYDRTLCGELVQARAIFDEVLATGTAFGLKKHVAYALENLGNISTLEGNYIDARLRLRQSLVFGRELGDHHLLLYVLGDLTKLEAAIGMPERAARLGGIVTTLRAQLGASMAPAEDEEREQALQQAHSALDDGAFWRAFDDGRALTFDAALAYALN